MSIISIIAWKLMPGEKKLKKLRERGLVIGEGCEILNGYNFGSEPSLVEIGNNVRITRGVNITTHDGGVWVLRRKYPELSNMDRFGKVKIGDNCHIGMNSLIMPGVTIGKNCIIGAGAIVTHDIPDDSVAVGIPARVIETVEEYMEKNKKDLLPTKNLGFDEKRTTVKRYCEKGLIR